MGNNTVGAARHSNGAEIESRCIPAMTKPETSVPQRDTSAVLRLSFLTLFLDLMGFSLIFPLFPSMLEYYREASAGSGLFGWFHEGLVNLSQVSGADPEWGVLVLFGGILGSVYSLLQFVFAPLFGALSDRYGRRPILLLTLCGMFLSYVLWFFAARFEVLLLARFLGGIMSANISIVSAIVTDVTPREQRARGMAVLGIAFGMGFVLGPAIGGAATLLDLTAWWPELAAWGINPFSGPALISLGLTGVNLLGVAWRMPETRSADTAAAASTRTANPIALFRAGDTPGVARTNLVYFLFIFAFSGVEFTLTFMAAAYFGYGPQLNAAMLFFVGVSLALVQGGYVRRAGDAVGPRRMAVRGLMAMLPALALIAVAGPAGSQLVLYVGLLLAAVGMGQAVPCLTSLVTLYASDDEQGRINGLFRSVGALGRALGPLSASVIYWQFGSVSTYGTSLAMMVVALLVAVRLPEIAKRTA
jgi:MFS family permease